MTKTPSNRDFVRSLARGLERSVGKNVRLHDAIPGRGVPCRGQGALTRQKLSAR